MIQRERKSHIDSGVVLGITILSGNLFSALGVAIFTAPSEIAMGGVTGLVMATQRFVQVPFARSVLLLNILFLLFGSAVLGKKFFLSTVASSVLYPLFIEIIEYLPIERISPDDKMLSAVLGGLLVGIGGGVIMRQGMGTGGTDAIAQVLNKWSHVSVGPLVSIINITIMGIQVDLQRLELILYGIVFSLVQSLVIDRVMILGSSQLQMFIISEKQEQIRAELLSEMHVGVTLINIETGAKREKRYGIQTVIHPRDFYRVCESVQKIDENAFFTTMQVKEVRGQGFSKARVDQYISDRVGGE